MMEDNKQLAQRIDGAIQSASQEVTNLRSELSATSRRLAELGASSPPGLENHHQHNHHDDSLHYRGECLNVCALTCNLLPLCVCERARTGTCVSVLKSAVGSILRMCSGVTNIIPPFLHWLIFPHTQHEKSQQLERKERTTECCY